MPEFEIEKDVVDVAPNGNVIKKKHLKVKGDNQIIEIFKQLWSDGDEMHTSR